MSTFSTALISYIQARKKAQIAGDLFNKDVLINQLKSLYTLCLASEDLLLDAAKVSEGKLKEYYSSHYEEEKGEIVVLANDLSKLNIQVSEIQHNPDCMALVGTQYYMLKHVHPVCLLGYMAVQEADPNTLELVQALEETHGRNVLRFIRMHAIKDKDHRVELLDLINSLDKEERKLVKDSADSTLNYLAKIYREVH